MSRVALVTGAAGGVGAAVAAAFARAGHALVLCDAAMPTALPGAEALCLAVTPADPAAVAAAFAAAEARFGRLDVLANMAGADHPAPLEAMPRAEWERVMDQTVGAMFLTAKHGLPLLARGSDPVIVNLAGAVGRAGGADRPAVATAMAAVESFTWALAGEAAERGVRVAAVAPGAQTDAGAVADAVVWLASAQASFVTGTTLALTGTTLALDGGRGR